MRINLHPCTKPGRLLIGLVVAKRKSKLIAIMQIKRVLIEPHRKSNVMIKLLHIAKIKRSRSEKTWLGF